MFEIWRMSLISASFLLFCFADQCCYPQCGSSGCNPSSNWCSQSTAHCASCKGHFCPAGPSPPPAPPGPAPAGLKLFCPSADDLTVAYDSLPLQGPQLKNQGWTIPGNGGVATKATFNLLGGSVEYDVDFSSVHKGVNANIYTISPTIASVGYHHKTDYCDGAATGPKFCLEVDWVESNGNCGGATTLHTIEGPGPNGCTSWGCRASYTYNGKASFHMKIEYGSDGSWTTFRDGRLIAPLSPVPSASDWAIVKSRYESKGALIYSSEWEGWVPMEDQCGAKDMSKPDLDASRFSVSNLKIVGSVVQGPTPTLCSQANVTGASSWCSSRGGCSCDCSWASAGCGKDDGSCCWGCCCAPSPTPPAPPPTPPPGPSPCGPHSTPVECHGRLGLGGEYGTQLVDQNGHAVQLRGMSVFNPGSYDDCITPDSVKHLVTTWGISILRIPMTGDPAVYNQRAAYVDYARDAGIYAIVDFHYTGTTPVVDDNARNFWRTMAARFKDYTNVFYETFNEPGPDADWNSAIKPFHEEMLKIIRPLDPHAIVLCGTRRWSQMVWQVPGNEVQPSKNVMYVRHSYAATHRDFDAVAAVLNKIPIFMSEWGVCDASGAGSIDGASAQTWVDMMAAKSHNPYGVTISWANWAYDDKGESCAALQPGACPAHDWDRTSQSGNMVRGYLKERLSAGLSDFTELTTDGMPVLV